MRTAIAPASLAAWLMYVAIDFLAHAVLLASWWRATASFWLPPAELMRRIPLGYASFAIYSVALTWLLMRLYGPRPATSAGLRFGALAGIVFGAMGALGSYSAFDIPVSFLIVLPATSLVESTAAGAAAAGVLSAPRPWPRAGLIAGLAVLLLAAGIVMQNLWLRPPTEMIVPGP